MLKKSLMGLAVVALIASVAQAGAAKIEDWPGDWVCVYQGDAADVATLKVMLKIPWWIKIHPQPDINLKQVAFYTDPTKPEFGLADFEGSTDPLEVCANFKGTLSTKIEPTADGLALQPDCGSWYSDINPKDFVVCCTGGFVVKAGVKKVNLHNKEACQTLHVADVTIMVKPACTGVCECCP